MPQDKNIKRPSSEPIITDLSRALNTSNWKFYIWCSLLITNILIGLYAYFLQLKNGLGITGLHDYSSWGLYLSNFVFFIAVSLIGMFFSSVLTLLHQTWAKPLSRLAEIISLAFSLTAALIIILDMGRPDRVFNVLIHGRLQSPIIWDFVIVNTYIFISFLLLLVPLLPDAYILNKRNTKASGWKQKVWRFLARFGTNSKERIQQLNSINRGLSILVIPVALAIHTVTSWLFASTVRDGWDSSLFGPYFVSGAFVSGIAALIILVYVVRKVFRLEAYIPQSTFDKIGKLLVLMSLIYLYFNINELLPAVYKMKEGQANHLSQMLSGSWAIWFWSAHILGNLLPIILPLFKKLRRATPLLFIASITFLGAWIKRYIIVIPVQLHPYLPIENVPEHFHYYQPTWPEIAISTACFSLSLLIITFLLKLFPAIPIWENLKEKEKN